MNSVIPNRILQACIILAALFAIVVTVQVLLHAVRAQQDSQLYQTASDISRYLNGYTNTYGTAPDSLAKIYTKPVPPSIAYTKLSQTSYRFCVTYVQTSDEYTPPDHPITVSPPNGLYMGYLHAAGADCQTVMTRSASTSLYLLGDPNHMAIASGNQSTACEVRDYGTHFSGTILTVKRADGQPIVPTISGDMIYTIRPTTANVTGVQTISIPEYGINVYNRACTAITHESVSPGDQVSYFTNNSDKYMLPAMVDFSASY